jgi:REP element-mobilizing transposase RayT
MIAHQGVPRNEWHSRGRLPHWEAGEVAQHLTIRLGDSLPGPVLESWKAELEAMAEAERLSGRRLRIETALDLGGGSCWLQQPPIARIVEDALLHFDGIRYYLHAWVVMPNHVHALATPIGGHSLSSLAHSWKSFTAKEANRLLSRQGVFWQEEYFDRAMRDARHFQTVVDYIEQNPVNAGLVAHAGAWEFSSAHRARDL